MTCVSSISPANETTRLPSFTSVSQTALVHVPMAGLDKTQQPYNLAQSYVAQNRLDEAHALVDDIRQRFPDYLSGHIDWVRRLTAEQRYEEAQAILDRLMTRKRWHFSEFAAFAGAQIELHLAESNRTAAKSWLEMWRQADPDHPSFQHFPDQIDRKTSWRDRMRLSQ